MARIRIIKPEFVHFPPIRRVDREARLFFILLWTVADDAGRLCLDPQELAEELYATDNDALTYVPIWLDELERAKCIERYKVETTWYLRIVNWGRHQTIDRPTPSRLPASPSEQKAAREAREPREESPESQQNRASEGNPREDLGGQSPPELSQERVLRDLDHLLRSAVANRSHTAAPRYLELLGRHVGLWAAKGTGTSKQDGGKPIPRLIDNVRPETGRPGPPGAGS